MLLVLGTYFGNHWSTGEIEPFTGDSRREINVRVDKGIGGLDEGS